MDWVYGNSEDTNNGDQLTDHRTSIVRTFTRRTDPYFAIAFTGIHSNRLSYHNTRLSYVLLDYDR